LTSVIEGWTGTIQSPHEAVHWSPHIAGWPLGNGEARPVVVTVLDGTSVIAAMVTLSLWRLGYAPAPLDVRLTPAAMSRRLRRLLPLRPNLLVTTPSLESLASAAITDLDDPGIRVVILPADVRAWNLPLPRQCSLDDPGLIVFTSGTTAEPRAVELSRGAILACANEVAVAQESRATDVCLNCLPFSHVNAPVVALLSTVISGGDLIHLHRVSPRGFWSAAEHATWANLVPPLIRMLVTAGGPTTNRLRFVRSASAPLPASTMVAFEHEFRVPVVESYGVSEAASQVTLSGLGDRRPGWVGTPRGVRLEVRDALGGSLPAGEVGVIAVSGPTLMRGYVGDPRATAEAIRDGWFVTSDLGSLDDAGRLRVHGRTSEVINRGGEKIAPREVEEALLAIDGVADAAAVAVPDDRYGEVVGAYVVLRAGASFDPAGIRRVLHDELPVFARPAWIKQAAVIPRDGAGKLQRNQLTRLSGPSEDTTSGW
jgi:acyl-CoA synthetase (AMP-forming)/AMP-acid ligase II